ncbi:MAG: TIGR04283 family arsenosugar biosynthesis glycosyltransferase [Beijerinckiaceae bacterium]|nr:TIGR04283 family arsenosugar biosynthesis glycosyltransferase [Beijerinckiaceae bacterium]
MHKLCIILPMLDEAAGAGALLSRLQPWRARGHRIVVADGGSRDATPEIARPLCDALVTAPRGRASQMNAGAALASEDILLFLHADTQLPPDAPEQIVAALAGEKAWGRFDVRIEGRSRLLPVVARMMNWRSRLGGIATGDQAMFMRRSAFEAVGGFDNLPIMEDIALSRRLLRLSRPACLSGPAVTSGRRWDRHGALRTIVLMWRLRAAFYMGADAHELAAKYGYGPGKS